MRIDVSEVSVEVQGSTAWVSCLESITTANGPVNFSANSPGGNDFRGYTGTGGNFAIVADDSNFDNASTIMAFLAWFGGTGYLLTRHARLLALASLGISVVAGLFAGWVVFRFMVKLVQRDDAPMTTEDRRVEGALGTVSLPIRENGTGEIIFSLGETRRCAGARSGDGRPIEKGAEIVIERYEKGIAYVRRWEEFSK